MYEDAQKYFAEIYNITNKLVIYRSLLEDTVIVKVMQLVQLAGKDNANQADIESFYYDACYKIIEQCRLQGISEDLWKKYLLQVIKLNENVFSLACEKFGPNIGEDLEKAALHDLEILNKLLDLKWGYFKNLGVERDFEFTGSFTEKSTSNPKKTDVLKDLTYQALVEYYQNWGAGKIGFYRAFRWEREVGLVGLRKPEKISFEDLIGYEEQKAILQKNTVAFLQDKPANNILLFGDRGTGKSSSVKALLKEYSTQGLRIIEIGKHQLGDFTAIINEVSERNAHFIIFIDDLSFEDFETEYKHLKAAIEGGIEAKPNNVLIYATSNRRHLIKETWADRDNLSGDIHGSDTMQEKLSLVDRFGITITYTTPDQDNFLNIVQGLADKHGIKTPANELREQALQWAMWHNGRSGRTAKQFINYLLG